MRCMGEALNLKEHLCGARKKARLCVTAQAYAAASPMACVHTWVLVGTDPRISRATWDTMASSTCSMLHG